MPIDPLTRRLVPFERLDLLGTVYRQWEDEETILDLLERLTEVERRGA